MVDLQAAASAVVGTGWGGGDAAAGATAAVGDSPGGASGSGSEGVVGLIWTFFL